MLSIDLDTMISEISKVKGRLSLAIESSVNKESREELLKGIELEKELISLIQSLNDKDLSNEMLRVKTTNKLDSLMKEYKKLENKRVDLMWSKNIETRMIVDMEILFLVWNKLGIKEEDKENYKELRSGVDTFKKVYYNTIDRLSKEGNYGQIMEITDSLEIPEVYIFMNLIPKVKKYITNINELNHIFKMHLSALLQINLMGIKEFYLYNLKNDELKYDIENAINAGVNSIIGYMVLNHTDGDMTDYDWESLKYTVDYIYNNVYESLKEVNLKLSKEEAPDSIRDFVMNDLQGIFPVRNLGKETRKVYIDIVKDTIRDIGEENINDEAITITLLGMNMYI